MDTHLALSSLITLSFFLAILLPSYCTDDESFVECSRPYGCGRIKFSYPFWGGDRPEHCGRQGFELECYYNEYPIIKFKELEFLVLSESQNNMTIARLDLWHGSCPQTYPDTVLNHSIFDYSPTVLNITLFYNCPLAVSTLIPVQNRFNCSWEGSDRNDNAYFVNESFAKFHGLAQCRGKIRVPISRNAIIDESAGVVRELHEALNQGFEVDYDAVRLACSGCVESGGYCGSNVTHQFVCFCRDGERSYNCQGKNMLALFSSHFPGLGYSILLVLGLVLMVYT